MQKNNTACDIEKYAEEAIELDLKQLQAEPRLVRIESCPDFSQLFFGGSQPSSERSPKTVACRR